MPPLVSGVFVSSILGSTSGILILVGVGICVAGIFAAGMAGMSKEKDFSPEGRTAVIKEFDLKKGLLVATFCGIMSACFSYGLAAGGPVREAAARHGAAPLWQGLPVLIIVMGGGFTTNLAWCVILHVRNRTARQYFQAEVGARRVPLLANYVLSAFAGLIWYMQFFFYTMGEVQMGRYRFSSWTLHMASIMIFGSLWGLALKEWQGAGVRTMRLLALSLATLVISTLVVGYGNYLSTQTPVVKATSARSRVG
jgi:L-rhamnose-H+ transport protein